MPFPSPGDLLDPGIEPVCPGLAGAFFTAEPPGEPVPQGREGKKGTPGVRLCSDLNDRLRSLDFIR